MIFVVPFGTFPRTMTKGTVVRRKVMEETMQEKLDQLFSEQM
jgi:hypothetical protein